MLDADLLEQIRPELEAIKPMSAVFDRHYVKRLDGPNVKKRREQARAGGAAARGHPAVQGGRTSSIALVMIWCGSTEVYLTESRGARERRRVRARRSKRTTPRFPSSMVYAYAAIKEGIPYANAAPNLSADIPALLELAQQTGVAGGGQGSEDRPDAG